MKMSKTLMNVLRLAAVGVAVFFGTQAHAQTVSGRVVDASGQPVIGATVVVDGTQNGAATGMDGGRISRHCDHPGLQGCEGHSLPGNGHYPGRRQ